MWSACWIWAGMERDVTCVEEKNPELGRGRAGAVVTAVGRWIDREWTGGLLGYWGRAGRHPARPDGRQRVTATPRPPRTSGAVSRTVSGGQIPKPRKSRNLENGLSGHGKSSPGTPKLFVLNLFKKVKVAPRDPSNPAPLPPSPFSTDPAAHNGHNRARPPPIEFRIFLILLPPNTVMR